MSVWPGRALSERQLRLALATFFLALAMPAALLFYHAYGQVEWEVFHQHRQLAEELSARIEADVVRLIDAEESRSFADYGFLVLAGKPGANFLQRSALSAYPPDSGLPGVVGYFQVNSAGELSSPILPAAGVDYRAWGVSAGEYSARVALRDAVQAILLQPGAAPVRDDGDIAQSGAAFGEARKAPAVGYRAAVGAENEKANVFERLANVYEQQTAPSPADDSGKVAGLELDEKREKKSRAQDRGDLNAPTVASIGPVPPGLDTRAGRKEQVAMLEEMPRSPAPGTFASGAVAGAPAERADAEETAEFAFAEQPPKAPVSAALADRRPAVATPERARAPASVTPAEDVARESPAPGRQRPQVRVRLFESEIAPLTFDLLDDRHLVLFRTVWRAGERFIQGAVMEREGFLDGAIARAFRGSAVSAMSDLNVAYRGTLLASFAAGSAQGYTSRARALGGELLYRTRLPAPLGHLELLYGVARLPLGTGVQYLAWLGLAFVLVLSGGCYAIYRFGTGQMALYRQQQDFVSAVSHELKTPLTSIRMYSEILQAGWADEAKKQRYYAFIHDESERLSRLIANVLQLARLNRGNAPVELRPEPVGALLDAVTPKLRSQADAAGFTLVLHDGDGVRERHVTVDIDAFTQILINLVDNAIKFSPDGAKKQIDLACRWQGDGRVIFSVRDYGAGIPREQMKKIFGLFYRAENELTRETVGTGIGLALVHQLVSRMDGRVDVVNRDPGSEFLLEFPATDEIPH